MNNESLDGSKSQPPKQNIAFVILLSSALHGIYAIFRTHRISEFAAPDLKTAKLTEYWMFFGTCLYFLSLILEKYYSLGYFSIPLSLAIAVIYFGVIFRIANQLIDHRGYTFKFWLLPIFGPFYLQWAVNYQNEKKNQKRTSANVAAYLIISVILGCYGITHSYSRISNDLMSPLLQRGDFVLINNGMHSFDWQPSPGELVMVSKSKERGNEGVRRIAAVAGDRVTYGPRILQINGKEICEFGATSYKSQCKLGEHSFEARKFVPTMEAEGPHKELTLKAGEFFIIADNHDTRQDSRDYGPIERTDIIGSVDTILFHFSDWRFDQERNLLKIP